MHYKEYKRSFFAGFFHARLLHEVTRDPMQSVEHLGNQFLGVRRLV